MERLELMRLVLTTFSTKGVNTFFQCTLSVIMITHLTLEILNRV